MSNLSLDFKDIQAADVMAVALTDLIGPDKAMLLAKCLESNAKLAKEAEASTSAALAAEAVTFERDGKPAGAGVRLGAKS